MRKTSALFSVLFLVCGAAFAQTTSGSITGSVLDQQDAAVPGATVTAREQQRQFVLSTTTEASGRFAFTQVPPGVYTLGIEAPGFKTYERSGITLNANDKLALGEIRIDIGSLTEKIVVRGDAVTLQAESAERSAALVATQMENIAVNSRSFLDLARLAPGVVDNGGSSLQTGGTGGLGNIVANGVRSRSNQLTINGISNVDTGSNAVMNVSLSLDSVQEYKMLTGVYQAEFGRSMGAQISVVTKSGTSELHGSSYWFHRHDSLNANNWINNRNGLPRSLFRFNDFGYTLGGPVYIPKLLTSRQKLFFFWSQEFQRQLRPQATKYVTVPSELERQGDFSQSRSYSGGQITIKDPTTGAPFPGNVIPANRQYVPGMALLKLLPKPNVAGSCALTEGAPGCFSSWNYQSQISDNYPRREDLIRVDFNPSSKLRFFGHYINNDNTFDTYYGSFVLATNVPIASITYANPGYSWAVGNTYTFGPTATNEFNIGASHNSILIDSTTGALTRTASGVNLPLLYPDAVQRDYLPGVYFGATAVMPYSPYINWLGAAPFINYNTTIDITDSMSKQVNRHLFKAGVYLQNSRKDQTTYGGFDGTYDFTNNPANALDTGFAFSNAAIGVFNQFSQAANFVNGQFRYWNIEVYGQDTWKVTSRLTLDYGLRMAWYQPQYDASLQASTFVLSRWSSSQAPRLYYPWLANGVLVAYDPVSSQALSSAYIGYIVPDTGSVLNGIEQGGANGFTKYLQNSRGLQWGPRMGVAWDPTGKQKLVIRTGGGIYYDRIQGNRVFNAILNPPAGLQPVVNYGLASQINASSGLLSPPVAYAVDPTGKIPTTYSFTFGLQTRLPAHLILDAAYVGTLGRHLQDTRNLNYVPYGSTFAPQNQYLPANLLRPMTGFDNISLLEANSTSNYNSLQINLTRKVGRLFLGVAYTWSKNLTTAPNDTDSIRPDQYARQANYGPSLYDRRHNFVVNYVYDLPRLANRSSLLKTMLGGWQISGITSFVSGAPYGVAYQFSNTSQQAITGSQTEAARVVLLGNPATGSDDPYNRLNSAMVAPPRVGSLGLESGVNYLTGPGVNNWDLSLQKQFSLKERLHLQLRADAFNVFNHTQFSGVNNTIQWYSVEYPVLLNPSSAKIDGFGTVSGARDPRIMQLMVRLQF